MSATFNATDVNYLDITGLDVGGDKELSFKFTPSEGTASMVVYTSSDGTNFDDSTGDYSYSATAFDNAGAQVYGSNGDNRAHVTPNNSSNLIGLNGICGCANIYWSSDANKITLIEGSGVYSEPDNDTNKFLFACARENEEVLKTLRIRFRKKSDASFIDFSGTVKVS